MKRCFHITTTTGALVLALAAAQIAAAQCGSGSSAKSASYAKKNIVATAQAAGQFNTLLTAATKAGLADALSGDGPLTVFAPTDEAFAKLPKGTVEKLLKPENREQLQAILKYHVIAGKLTARDVMHSSGAPTLNGQRVDFATKGKTVHIDGATVVKADVAASNGVIHVIDQVILPSSNNIVQTAKSAEAFKTLLTAATEAGLADTLANGGPFTVFAPTDDAFSKLPDGTLETLLKPENRGQLQAILKYHVVPGRVYSTDALSAGKARTLQGDDIVLASTGGKLRVNEARILTTDLDASNGVIHVIDTVILPN